jgi:hypothetical protein
MAVEILNVRKAAEITWDTDTVKGKNVEIVCENVLDGDLSTRKVENDGKAVITFPEGYAGEVNITVKGAGQTSDSGVVNV